LTFTKTEQEKIMDELTKAILHLENLIKEALDELTRSRNVIAKKISVKYMDSEVGSGHAVSIAFEVQKESEATPRGHEQMTMDFTKEGDE
jgi:hypothetical protein